MIQIQDNISEQKNLKDKLEGEQEKLHVEYNKVSSRFQTHRTLHISSRIIKLVKRFHYIRYGFTIPDNKN